MKTVIVAKQKNQIAAKIDRSFEQFKCGEGLSPEQVRTEMDKRKAHWLAERHSSRLMKFRP